MSTKTTFKRVAAVAAAALAIGGFSAVSAHATAGDIVVTAGTNTGTATAATVATTTGASNFVGFTLATGGDFQVVVTGGTANSSATSVTGSGTATLVAQANAGTTAFTVPTPSVGTIVVKAYPYTAGVLQTTATSSLTITVTAAATGVGTVSLANSTAFITESSTVYASATASVAQVVTAHGTMTTAAADDVTPVAKGAAGTSAFAAMIVGKLVDSTSSGGVPLGGKTLTATISGSGLLTGKGAAESPVATTAARVATSVTSSASAGFYAFGVYSDGTAGVGTITISYTDSSNVTTVVATKTITFYGSAATYTPTVKYAYIPNSGNPYPASVTSLAYAVKIKVTDAAGNAVSGVTPTVKSADTTIISAGSCAASTATGSSYCSLTGVSGAHGKTTVTFYTGSAATFDLISTTADITVSSLVADSFVITGDATASSGNVITYTITAKDKYGNPIPDGQLVSNYVTSPAVAGGAMTDYSAVSTNTASTLFAGVKFSGGVATDSIQAPFGSTSIVATFDNIGAGTATIPASVFTTLALTNAETVVTTTVGGDSAVQAATDAAQEATDAANAAYDAANNAMDSADAATAAAQDAADNASAALAAVTSLSATVAKLVKSVAAIAAALAKVQKKIGA